MRTIERHLQQYLNKEENCALYNGFKFPNPKHNVSIFVNLDNHMIILNYIIGSFIPVVDEAKFLGVIFPSFRTDN